MRFNTPLRYPGGKGKLLPFINNLLTLNGMQSIHYAEPYAGGAGLALNLLFKNLSSEIYLNDINPAVHAFWHSVLNESESLCNLISQTEVTIDEWHKQKKIISTPYEQDTLSLGFATFFLNRTNRSGILKGGVIGGKKQDGKWKLDARFNKDDLIKRIIRIASQKEHIHLSNMDASDFLDLVVKNLPSNSLTYLDPPYFIKGKGLYENHYELNDHAHIAKKVTNELSTPWIVSYDNVAEINEMYAASKNLMYGINYSAQHRYIGSEIMYFSESLKIPKSVG
ncbi:DNA adenine methylase [Hafnia paralvei]|uniref:DNA adenine methylase n=1 Tax=Hafnia paralvei TaxID=546367 RepID=UPI0010346516|nr:DNA adenine methylase [Hafnia paralvei]TBM14744.1 DNA adenine methylase [Hafnia paralvei]